MPTLAEDKAVYAVETTEQEVEVSFKNPIRELGFAQIEHVIGLDVELSDGAYRTLSILHYFWQQKKRAFPSLETLAKLRGKSSRTISEHLAELEEKGIITRARRMGTSSMTYLEDLPQEYIDAAQSILTERMQKTARKTGRKLPVAQEENFSLRITREEEQVVEPTTTFEVGDETKAEKDVGTVIMFLGWQERQEIREMAEQDKELDALQSAIKDFKPKVEKGDYFASWKTFKKFWANAISTAKLRKPSAPAANTSPQWVNT